MRPDGAVVAMVGGRSYADSQFNRAVQAQRQPGSAFKLFDYYAALRQGYSPESEVLDAPVDVKGWERENYGRHYHGEVTLADAFADSMNAATVRLSQQLDRPNHRRGARPRPAGRFETSAKRRARHRRRESARSDIGL
ncbi:MAG TPA: penicillin-binding transpeptidase domain-containing protein [Bradyrhizobium sp.]|nr:penicillin-binding transpeptidase domain-containing protein [Bradyrhizobium sp.]